MATGLRQQLSPRYAAVIRLRMLAVSALTGGAALVPGVRIAALVLTGAVLFSAIVLVPFYCRACGYTRRGDGVVIECGLVFARTYLVGRRQVRYITVRRTPSERMLGLCTLIFVTCAGRVSLPGLRREEALRIRRAFEVPTGG